MEPAHSSALLKREVLPPERSEHGFGVLLVTSVGIFFAVMSSAFILQARAVRTCPAVSNTHDLHVVDEAVDQDAYTTPSLTDIAAEVRAAADGVDVDRPATECGRPSYRENADGSVSVFFEVCPDDTVLDLAATQGLGEPGIEVRRIHR